MNVQGVRGSKGAILLLGAVIGSCLTHLLTVHWTVSSAKFAKEPGHVRAQPDWTVRQAASSGDGCSGGPCPASPSDQYEPGTVASILPWKGRLPKNNEKPPRQPRKLLLDCGANVASTVQLFRETYPGGRDFTIHSFELDERLAPFFAPYPNHVLHCPTAVSNEDGNMTSYAESAWAPDKGRVGGTDMQWGGGTLFAFDGEKEDTEKGGRRKLSHRRTVPTVDLSRWIQENTALEDYVIFKLDVEGAEYDVLKKMLDDGTFKWVDKFYGEYHGWQPVPHWSGKDRSQLTKNVSTIGMPQLDWAAEIRKYEDFDALHPPLESYNFVGSPGQVYTTCSASLSGTPRLALVVLVGMNAKAAHKLVETIGAHSSRMPVTLFLYGDFVETFPELVTEWAKTFTIGMRENQPFPLGHFTLQQPRWIMACLAATIMRMSEVGIQTPYYLADNVTDTVIGEAKSRGLRIIQPTARFPPTHEQYLLTVQNYFKVRDVERTPKALRSIAKQLDNKGGILSLDSDHPDSYLISVFLMDYLAEKSGYDLVNIVECLK